LSSVEKYDPISDTWSSMSHLPVATYAHSGCVVNNTAYIGGGYCQGNFIQYMHAYNSCLDHWSTLAPMNMPRGWHCMTHFNDLIYVFGGCFINHANQLPAAPLQTHHQMPQHTANSVLNNHLVLLPHQQQELTQPVMLTECYNIRSNQWHTLKPIINMHKEAACVKCDTHAFIIGGYNMHAKTGQRFISKYEFATDAWSTAGQMPSGMTGMGVCMLDLPWFVTLDGEEKSGDDGAHTAADAANESFIWSRIDVDSDSELNNEESDDDNQNRSLNSTFNTSESESDRSLGNGKHS
jgi:N-acetylneuraminic acid mutarotase